MRTSLGRHAAAWVFVFSLAGCDAPVTLIGPEGGTVRRNDVTLTVPPGALSTLTRIKITPLEFTEFPEAFLAQFQFTSAIYRFEPAGQTFAVPATVKFGSGAASTDQLFWSATDPAGGFEALQPVAGDPRAAQITHFSLGFVGVLGDVAPSALSDGLPTAVAAACVKSARGQRGQPCCAGWCAVGKGNQCLAGTCVARCDTGCVDAESGACFSGTANIDGCGSGGALCTKCPASSQCVATTGGGSCQPCPNCWNSFGCQPGTGDFACGSGGAQCAVCSGGDHCTSSAGALSCAGGGTGGGAGGGGAGGGGAGGGGGGGGTTCYSAPQGCTAGTQPSPSCADQTCGSGTYCCGPASSEVCGSAQDCCAAGRTMCGALTTTLGTTCGANEVCQLVSDPNDGGTKVGCCPTGVSCTAAAPCPALP